MDTMLLEVVVVLVLVVLNGFFACSEFAIISIRKSQIAQLLAEGDERARLVDELQKDPHRILAVIQVGVTVVGATASAVGGIIAVEHVKPMLQHSSYPFLREAAEPISVTMLVVIVSYLLLIIGELAPKSIGLTYANQIALRVAKPIYFFARISSLVVTFLALSSKSLLRLLRIKAEGQEFITREEIEHIVAEGEESGVFTATEREYIENIFDFTHTSVREVMVPRTRMVGLDLDLPRDRMLAFILENEYSRYPVYRETIENIAGFIHGKDFLGRIVTDPYFDIAAIIRPPFYVPETKKVNELLRELQRKRIHMALVVDEYGGISGLVTTEDLLEELVGEIEDEHDVEEPRRVQRLPDGSLLVDALLSVSDLEDLLDVRLEADQPFDTLAGLILDRLGRFPDRGEELAWLDYRLICEEVTPTTIVRVRIIPPQPEPPVAD